MLRLSEAKTLCESVFTYGHQIKCNPLTVVVLDRGGHVLCAMREEDSGILRYEVAYGKAWGALGMGFGTRTYDELTNNTGTYQSFVHGLMGASNGKVIPTKGGVLIRNSNGDLLGAIGVSGDSSERDEACILYAVGKMKMIAQP